MSPTNHVQMAPTFQLDCTKFEYRYHTADLQIYSRGNTFLELIATSIFAIYHYISPDVPTSSSQGASTQNVDFKGTRQDWQTIIIEEPQDNEDEKGKIDLAQLLMQCLSEALFLFHGYRFLIFKVQFFTEGFDENALRGDLSSTAVLRDSPKSLRLSLIVDGEKWDKARHASGTEIKAITWSNFSVSFNEDSGWHAYFIVDI